jgi:hypothetical protein
MRPRPKILGGPRALAYNRRGFPHEEHAMVRAPRLPRVAPRSARSLVLAIDGYTDSSGLARWNRPLSQQRADGVEAFPIASNATIAARAKDRRVELSPTS